ncbi:pilus assembly protein [Geomobilimonas luticola]|uniref:VWA domain-containing protein n=1 Tax=Geomobilimonas luticola TaxID=1114878 RepID=A0ABS5S8U3_9BACT|nr:PilC/PilY family type IV pilus protein [Geomobilimonas luticola]MBT0651801.1 VWA domain-containing protein [Geomobilimonas luticola]
MGTKSTFLRNSTFLATVLLFCSVVIAVALAAISQTPLYLINGNQPNIMILLDNSMSMAQNVDGRPKIQSARTVVSNLVKSFPSVKFGLAVFNPMTNTSNGWNADGGKIVMPCGSLTAANVDATVDGISANSVTPLGETLAEVWQYFKGGGSSYNSGISYTSPITSSCQQSFTIIVTDGEPTADNRYKNDFSSYGWESNDNVNMTTTRLADVAKYMHEHAAVAAFPTSTITTYTVGFAVDIPVLQTAAANGGGQYFTAANEAALASALRTVVSNIVGMVSSASAVAVNTAYLTTSTKLYRARFDSRDWSGYLESYNLDKATGTIIGYPNSPVWEAGATLNARSTSRVIYTAGALSGLYKRTDFTTANRANIATAANFTNFSTNWVSYVRGDSVPTGYRSRASKLGDMVYSPPLVYGPPDGYYTDHNYTNFKMNNSTRQSLLLAGANDGMLHAFNVDTGEEEWAFIPSSLLTSLKKLRNNPYLHQSYVDGMITVGDAYFTSKNASGTTDTSPGWHSVAVCGLRAGGKSFFALDITAPNNPIPLWEITPQYPSANGLGYSFGTPLILKLKDNSTSEKFRWVAALPNGYEGSTGKASLIIADLATGTILKEVVVDNTTNNGLSTAAAIDKNGDGYADYLYAGDLKGRLWKFDVSGGGSGSWNGSLLFTAVGPSGIAQPITTAPDVVLRGSYQIVFFGTGKYLEDGDQNSTQTQSFYGIYDRSANRALVRSDLTQQTLTEVAFNGGTYRQSSDNPVGTYGWYADLPLSGERVITDPVAKSRKIIFTTFVPSTDPCSAGGISWLMELNMDTGGTLVRPAFDLNNNGYVDGSDTLPSGKYATGTRLGDGIASTPTIVGAYDGLEYKYITSSTGTITKLLEGGGTSQFGPRSWRQLK